MLIRVVAPPRGGTHPRVRFAGLGTPNVWVWLFSHTLRGK